METHEALINLDRVEPISEPLTESRIKTAFDIVSAEIEELKADAIRKQILKIDKIEQNQGLESPYRDVEVPENVKLTTQVSDVMYNFVRLPDHWVSKESGTLSDAIDLLQDKISARLFPETLIEETVRDLEVTVFALLFNLSIDLSELIYPIYKSLYLANEYVIVNAKVGVDENSIEFTSILDLLKKSDPEDFRERLGGDVMDYVKIIIYRSLLERIGNVTLPLEREEDALNVSKDLLMTLIPTSELIELGIITKGTEVVGSETSPFLTNFERARLIGERAREISEENAPVMTDPGSLTEAQAIAEKELDELVIPLKVCRKFPDGSERIWCASSLAKARDEFYDVLKEDLDKVSVEGLYRIALEHGYGSEIREKMLDLIRDGMGLEIQPELLELRALTLDEVDSLFKEIRDLLLRSGLSREDLDEPLYILRLLLPIMKTYPTLTRLLVVDVCSNFFDIYSDVEWVNIPGNAQTDPKDRPRRLTRDEIDDILDSLPQVRSALKGLSIEARRSMQDKMRSTLQEIEMCPSGIPELKQSIVIQFNKSRIDPGSAVGINAADALGEQVSQMTLNSVIGETKILLNRGKSVDEVKIGEWIDELMKNHSNSIKLYPENRTEYLALKSPVRIPTVSEEGKVFWSDVTAITRHLPGNNLVRIKTNSGREVTVTESKSLLVWNESKRILEQTNGSDVKLGDSVPVDKTKPNITGIVVNDVILDRITEIEVIKCENDKPFVYDLTVPSTTNFCLANGLGVADTFHSAGSNKNMSSGIRALSELIYAMKTRKNDNCVIVFKERLSFDEILEKEADIVQTNVGQLVVDWIVDHPDNLDQFWWRDYFTLPDIDDTTRVLRLQLNPALMVERKVTMSDIVRGLNKGQKKEGIPPSSLYYAHSSTKEGILDIYPHPALIKQSVGQIEQKIGKGSVARTSNRGRYRPDIFLNNIVLANLDYIHIRGVLDIEEIYVTKAPVLEIVAKEYKIGINERSRYGLDPGTYWRVVYDVNLLAYSPIKPGMLLELLEFVDYEVIVKEEDGCIVIHRGTEEGSVEGVGNVEKNKPSDTIKREVGVAEEVEEKKDLTDYQRRLLFLDTYNLLNTRGSNLVGLMEKMDIDMYYTYSNNIHLMKEIYGVEAARQFFIKELYDAFTNQDGYVNARNISLLADFLFRYGSFLGTNYTGMKAGTMGYFSLATFERSLEVLVKAAIFSETETLEGVSAAIAVGKPVTIGTGFFNIISDHASNTIRKKERREEKRLSDAKAITLAMGSGICPGSFGDETDDLDFRKNFFAAKKYQGGVERVEEGPPTPKPVIEMAEEPTECPPGDVVQPPAMLEEAMEELPFEVEAPDLSEEEIKTRVVEIPSQIRQVSLRPKGRAPVAPPGTPLSETEEEEITELEGPEENIEFIDIPVIQL